MKIHNIPEFPEFVNLEQEHMELLQGIFKTENFCISEFDFTELYAWRKPANIQLSEIDNGLCIGFTKKQEKFICRKWVLVGINCGR